MLCIAALVTTTLAPAIVPEHTMENGAVHLKGVGPDNPDQFERKKVDGTTLVNRKGSNARISGNKVKLSSDLP